MEEAGEGAGAAQHCGGCRFRRVSISQAAVQLRREFPSSCKRASQHLHRLLETKSGVSPPRCPHSLPALCDHRNGLG